MSCRLEAPVVAPAPEGEDAIKRYREGMGENAVHGSDAPETAAQEIAQFFSGNEIVGSSEIWSAWLKDKLG